MLPVPQASAIASQVRGSANKRNQVLSRRDARAAGISSKAGPAASKDNKDKEQGMFFIMDI